jgi:glutamate-1-semialdehyde 2,1-aminomutase
MNKRYEKSNYLIERALKSIPLGSQTFSKSITQYPRGISPLFISKGKGSKVWDVDNNCYVDFVNGLLSVMLGYCDSDVNESVLEQLESGVSFSLPHPIEMEVAELLIELVPCAEMVRFGKNGSDATSAAIRLSRAYTGKEHVLVCGYHGWQDWFIGSTSMDLGVPFSVKALTHSFDYNDIDTLNNYFEEYKDKIACVIMEPMSFVYPQNNFLEKVKKVAHANDALLIFDETITGCRFSNGGAQELFGVKPDLATFGKGIANGFPLSAIMGRREIMLKMEEIFFSGTFGGETISLAAAKAVLLKVRDNNVLNDIKSKGEYLISCTKSVIDNHNVSEIFEIIGHPSWSLLKVNDFRNYSSWIIKTYLFQELFKRGILFLGTHNLTFAHSTDDINNLVDAYNDIFPELNDLINKNILLENIHAKPIEPLFKVRK